MTTMIIFVGIALALLLALLWLMRERPQARELTGAELKSRIEELFPLHLKYFAQVRQALSPADQQYLKERASRRIQRQARAERLAVARRFLDGLRDDFFRLERLGRAVAALSPAVSRPQEAERLWLGLRFRILHRIVWLRLATGGVSLPQLTRLTELVGNLAAQIEASMAALEEVSMSRLRSGLSA